MTERPLSELLRDRLLDAALNHIPRLGWSKAAINAAAVDAGLTPGEAELAAPGGPAELLEAFSARNDALMAAAMPGAALQTMKIREKVRACVKARIEAMAEHKEAVRRGAAFLALPMNAPLAARLHWKTADCIWRQIGDRSTDENFYSKRAILAGVNAATMLRWLADKDPRSEATWAFLDDRIDGVIGFEKVKARARDAFSRADAALAVLARLRYGGGGKTR